MSTISSIFVRGFNRFFYAFILCFGAGVVSSTAMAPYNFWPALLIGFSVLYGALTQAKSKKAAFAYGWVFSFGYFVFSLSWIGNALLVEGNAYKWAWPLAVTALPAVLALYHGVAATLLKAFFNLRSMGGWLGFIALLSLAEWLRGHLFTGFPWNTYGYTWSGSPFILQGAALGNVYLLTTLTVLWLSTPIAIWFMQSKPARLISGVSAAALLLLIAGFGAVQLSTDTGAVHDNLNIRMVQPNIPQHEKWDRTKTQEHFEHLIQLSKSESDQPTIIVWPETALNFRMMESPSAPVYLQNLIQSYPQDAQLLTGMMRYDLNTLSYRNSLVMINETPRLQNVYDKHHLVPFGEYIPFQKYIPLQPVVQFKGFEKGEGLQQFESVNGLQYSPLICYEIIFPGRAVRTDTAQLPDFIINTTNDAWYGVSAGPHQHLVQAQYRAVETGIPVIRITNTGFSAILSPYGAINYKTGLFETIALNTQLPVRRNYTHNFLYIKHYIPLIFISFLLFTATLARRTRTNSN